VRPSVRYTPEQFQATMAETAGLDLSAWFADALSSTKALDFTEALDFFGLRFTPVDLATARATIGASPRNDNGRLVVSLVRRGTPAHHAGVNVDDEILAIDDVRVRADGLVARMDQYKGGDRIRLLVARRDRLMALDVTLAPEPGRLQPTPDATAEQKARLDAWLGQ
jgi:predicted metalloprotease with PDZ domain